MKGFAFHAAAPTKGTCAGCAWFAEGAAQLEAAWPALRSMGSAYASVRGDDGLCDLHGRVVGARARCPRFAPKPQIAATDA